MTCFPVAACVRYCCSSITIFAALPILQHGSNHNPQDILYIYRSGAGERRLTRQAGLHEYASTPGVFPFGGHPIVPFMDHRRYYCLSLTVARLPATCLANATFADLRPDCHIESLQLRRRVDNSLRVHTSKFACGIAPRRLSLQPSEAVIDTIVAADTTVSGCYYVDAKFVVSMPPQWQ